MRIPSSEFDERLLISCMIRGTSDLIKHTRAVGKQLAAYLSYPRITTLLSKDNYTLRKLTGEQNKCTSIYNIVIFPVHFQQPSKYKRVVQE